MPSPRAAAATLLARGLRRYPFRGKGFLWSHVSGWLPRDTQTATLPGSGRMTFDLSLYWQRQMFAGCFERRSVWAASRLLAPGDTFIDAGANCGLYACLASGIVGRQGAVHAFEPDPRLHAQLRQQAALNAPTLVIHQGALSDADAEGELHLAPDDTPEGWALGIASLESRSGWRTERTPTWAIDSLLGRTIPAPVRLAKIDVEGHEASVLRGASRALADGRLESVLVELTDAAIADVLWPVGFEHLIDVRNGFVELASLDAVVRAEGTDLLCVRGAGATRWRAANRLTALL